MRKQNSCGDANELVTNFFTTDIDYMEDFHKKKKKTKQRKKKNHFGPAFVFRFVWIQCNQNCIITILTVLYSYICIAFAWN